MSGQHYQTVQQWEELDSQDAHDAKKQLTRTGSNMNVFKKLMTARMQLQVLKIEKTGLNGFAKYKYFELSDFLPAAQKIFNDVGLCGVVSYTSSIATLTIYDVDASSDAQQTIVITSPMGSAALKGVHEVQNIGAVETYQRRYLWVTALEIVEHDALDAGGELDTDKTMLNHAIKNIADAASKIELKKHYEAAIAMLDVKYHDTVKQAANLRREFLNEPRATNA